MERTKGFTLMEVMVSITILAIGVLALSGLLLRSARSAEAASAVSYQTAVMAAEVARYDALPYAQLAAGTTCDTVTGAPLPRIRCTTVTNLSAKLRQVKVKVTPTGNPLLQPDSVVFDRGISGDPVPPLNTP